MRRVALAVTLALLATSVAAAPPTPGKIAKVGVLAEPLLLDDPHFRALWGALAGALRDHEIPRSLRLQADQTVERTAIPCAPTRSL